MSNRAKRIWWSRLVAGILCLCMVVSAMQPGTSVYAAYTPEMRVYLYAWHSGEIDAVPIDLNGNELEDKSAPVRTLQKGDENLTIHAPEYKNEEFTAFSISAGQSATKIDKENKTVTVEYSSLIPMVKIYVFYSSAQDNSGMEFGVPSSVMPETDAEVDMVKVAPKEYYDKIGESVPESVQGEPTINVYNTSEGLHTNKDVQETMLKELGGEALTDVEKKRTFDVTLESWVAGENLADIGLVLDASGSMAWPAVSNMDTIDESWLSAYGIDASEKSVRPRILSSEEVDKVLNPNKTDNSLLGYSDYTYYVYDGRFSAQEYTPLGYWVGLDEEEEEEEEKEDTMDKHLVGYYPFTNKKLTNFASKTGESAKLIEKADGEKFDDSTEKGIDHLCYNTNKTYANGQNNINSVDDFYLTVYEKGKTDRGLTRSSGGNMLLDVPLTDNDFTISFAVCTDVVKATGNPGVLSDIMYIGPVDVPYNSSNSYRIARPGDSSRNRIKWDKKVGDSANLDGDVNIKAFSTANRWDVITYVVKDGTISSYINGEPAEESGNNRKIADDFFSDTEHPKRIIIGGADTYQDAASLYLDEIYIYDRSLNEEEVKRLYSLTTGAEITSTEPTGVAVATIKEDDGTVRNLARMRNNSDTKLGTKNLAGWYYVNPSSDVAIDDDKKNVFDLGTAKEFKPIFASDKFYEDCDEEIKNKFDLTNGHKGAGAPPESFTVKSGPSQFYIDENGYLCCIFDPGDNALSYSKIYVKGDGDKIKAERLQESLGMLVNEVSLSSPGSKVSAVRFSTKKYNDIKDSDWQDLLVMLNWTDDPKKSAEIMNLKRGGGTAKGADIEAGKHPEYNYLLTGGTYVASGLEAFRTELMNEIDSDTERKSKKYVIVFTDGKDDGDTEGDNNAEIQAAEIKKAGWTIYSVMLTGGALSDEKLNDARNFLGEFSDKVYEANSGDELVEVFEQIQNDIKYSLKDEYVVQDYIDPRFDLIARTSKTGEEELIPLTAREEKDKVKVIDIYVTGEAQAVDSSEEDGKKLNGSDTAELWWDGTTGMYFIKWVNQEIPGCSVNAKELNVWRASFTLRAKEDFIGGNAVLTNGQAENMNYVYSEKDSVPSSGTDDMYQKREEAGESSSKGKDAYPSKGFPRVVVNVGLLPRNVADYQTIYLREKLSPLDVAKELIEQLEKAGSGEDEDTESGSNEPGSQYYWEYLKRYFKATMETPAANDEELEENFAKFLQENLIAKNVEIAEPIDPKSEVSVVDQVIEICKGLGKSEAECVLEVPYAYLPADDTTQTGGATHEGDILGVLKYVWYWQDGYGIIDDEDEQKKEELGEDHAYITKATHQRTYNIAVKYEPLKADDTKATLTLTDTDRKFSKNTENLPNRIQANNGEDTTYAGLISDKNYHWRSGTNLAEGDKLPAGAVQEEQSGIGVDNVYIVRGELALKVMAEKTYLDQWFARHPEKNLNIQVDVTRVYNETMSRTDQDGTIYPEDETQKPLTISISEDEIEDLEPDENGVVCIYTYIYEEKGSAAASDPMPSSPPERPIGTYTLSIAENETAEDAKTSYPFTRLEYAGEDEYDGYFNVSEENGVLTKQERKEYKENHDTIKKIIAPDFSVVEESVGSSETVADSGEKGFYLGTKGSKSDFDESDPEAYLYARLGMVKVEPDYGNLTVKKEVTGTAYNDEDDDFYFTVTLKLPEEWKDDPTKPTIDDIIGDIGDFKETLDGEDFSFKQLEGSTTTSQATIKLKAGHQMTASYLPVGVEYTVEETFVNDEGSGENKYKGYTTLYSCVTNEISYLTKPTGSTSAAAVSETTDPWTGTIADHIEAFVTVENKRDAAEVTLSVSKVVEIQERDALKKEYTFEFELNKVDNPEPPVGGVWIKKDMAAAAASLNSTPAAPTATSVDESDDYVEFTTPVKKTITVKPSTTEPAPGGEKYTAPTIENFFKDVVFTKPGTYTYTLGETNSGETDIEYSKGICTITITVKAEGNEGKLQAEITGVTAGPDGEDDAVGIEYKGKAGELAQGEVIFTNKYRPTPVEVPIKAEKKINGDALTGGEFTLKLTAKDDQTKPYLPDKGTKDPADSPSVTVTNGEADGTSGVIVDSNIFDFGKITFDQAGTYTYTLEEVKDTTKESVYKYDETEYTITITVTDTKGVLGATLSYELALAEPAVSSSPMGSSEYADFKFQFGNLRLGNLAISKTVTGDAADDLTKGFNFTVTLTIPNELQSVIEQADLLGVHGEMTFEAPEGGDSFTAVARVAGVTNGTTVTATGLPAGVEYTISEDSTSSTGYTVDSTNATGTIPYAESDASGNLEAKTATAAFTNTRTAATVNLTATKQMTIAEGFHLLEDYDFTFELTPTPVSGAPSVDREGDPVATLPGKKVTRTIKVPTGTGTGTTPFTAATENFFKDLKFMKEGTFEYTLKEITTPAKAGVKYDNALHSVEVEVKGEPENSGNLVATVTVDGTSVSTDPQNVIFKNTYQPDPIVVPLQAKKNINGTAAREGEFAFILTAHDDAPMPAKSGETVPTNLVTVANDGSGIADFGSITFTKPGTYIYTMGEDTTYAGTEFTYDGIEYDSTEYTIQIEVVDDPANHGQLKATVQYQTNAEGSTVTSADSYKQTDGKFVFPFANKRLGDLTVTKTVTGNAGDSNDEFDFTVTLTIPDDLGFEFGITEIQNIFKKTGAGAGAGTGTGADNITVTVGTGDRTYEVSFKLKDGESVTATGLPVGTTYAMTEVPDDSANNGGYAVTQPAGTDKTVTGTIEQGEMASVAFTNTREPATVTLPLEKNLAYEGDGYNPQEHTFTFTLTGISSNPEGLEIPMPTGAENPTNAKVSVTVGANQSKGNVVNIFEGVLFKKPGTYVYSLTEDTGSYLDVKNDEKVSRTITVTVTPGANGQLQASAEVTGNGSGAATDKIAFTNTYTPDKVKLPLEITKRLENDTLLNAGEFSFTLTAEDGAPMPADAAGEQQKSPFTVTNDAGTVDSAASEKAAAATVNFGEITYTKPGTYTYSIKETKGTDSSIEYDETEYTVTVTVTDDGGQLKASAAYSGMPAGTSSPSGPYSAVFTNKRLLGDLTVTKTVAGDVKEDLSDDTEFHFMVTLDRTDIAGSYGMVEFKAAASGSYAKFTLKDEGSVTVEGLSAGTTYTVEETSPSRDGYNVTYTVTTTGTTTGSAVETITEQSAAGDNKAYTADGTIPANSTETNGTAEVAFTNTRNYTTAHLKARKTLTGLDAANTAEYDFTFELTPDHTEAKTGSTTAPENPLKVSKKLEVEGISSGSPKTTEDFFKGVTFKEEGTYYYTLTESSNPRYTGVQYDSTKFTVKVTVSADENAPGTLKAAVEVTPDISGTDKVTTETDGVTVTNVAAFTNNYKPDPVSVILEGKKEFTGGSFKGKDFRFKLIAGTTNNHEELVPPMPENAKEDAEAGGRWTSAAENNLDGEFEFGPITYTEAGTYTYCVREVEGDDTTNIEYDTKRYGVKVEVTESGGKLKAEVSYSTYSEGATSGKGDSEMKFTNVKITGDLTVTKKVTGTDGDRNKDFNFRVELTPPNEATIDGTYGDMIFKGNVATFTLKADQSLTAVGLPVGTTYTVTEEDSGNYTVSATVNSANVPADSDGTLVASGTITAEKAGEVVFENHKDKPQPTTAVLQVRKRLDVGTHGSHLESKTFTFTLTPNVIVGEPENPLPSTSVKTTEITVDKTNGNNDREWVATGENLFADIVFTEAGTYSYTLSESKNTGNDSGIHYDEDSSRTIIVEVTEADNKLSAVVKADDVPLKNPAIVEFKNSYDPSKAPVRLAGKKEFIDGTMKGDEFTFVLTAESGPATVETVPMPGNAVVQTDENGKRYCTAKNDAEGSFDFGNIVYDTIGEYVYTLSEDPGTDSYITYDPTVYTITVNVKEGTTAEETSHGVAEMTATVTWKKTSGNAAPESGDVNNGFVFGFTNVNHGGLRVEKQVSGKAADSDDTFAFRVTLDDKSINGWRGKVPADVKAPANGDGLFFKEGVAEFTLKNKEYRAAVDLPVGVTYSVEEVDGRDYSSSVTSAGTTVVGTARRGAILAGNTTNIVFKNSKEPAFVSLKGQKNFPGGTLKENDFTFILTADHVESETTDTIPMPDGVPSVETDGKGKSLAGTNVSAEAKNAAEGSFEFKEITYKNAGTYYYTLVEQKPAADDGIAYDEAAYTIRVEVKNDAADASGKLHAEVSWQKQGTTGWTTVAETDTDTLPVFTNRRKVSTSLSVTKNMNVSTHGEHLGEKTFTFRLTPLPAEAGQPAKNKERRMWRDGEK